MAKELFVEKKFGIETENLIVTLNEILDEYAADDYDLSLRQLYYQLVARDIVPNTEQSYKRIGGIVSDARLAGLIDWDIIKDRGRESTSNAHWDSPADIIASSASQFRYDLWADQPVHVEVMVEKQALEGVLEPVCRRLDVTFSANKGYSSSSALYESGKRLAAFYDDGKDCVVLYLGDHDPSGIDMTRDVRDRLSLFSGNQVKVKRLALNMDQIKKLKPPENPAKMTDSRATSYVAKFGHSSWELDAIEPKALAALVTEAVEELRSETLWNKALERQKAARARLAEMAKEIRAEEHDPTEDNEPPDDEDEEG
jgi:hypothetical protein